MSAVGKHKADVPNALTNVRFCAAKPPDFRSRLEDALARFGTSPEDLRTALETLAILAAETAAPLG
jgi:hypothetical protein